MPKDDIVGAGYELSFNRYKEIELEEIEYDSSAQIIAELREFETEISDGLTILEKMLK